MRPRLISITLPFLLLAAGAFAQEKLVLLPEKPRVGETFQVLLQPAPTEAAPAGQYTWEVLVLDEENTDITATAGPQELPNLPALAMPAVKAHTQYRFKLKIKTPAQELSLDADAGASRLVVIGGAAEALAPAAEARAETPRAVVSPEDNIELRKMGERLEAAKTWAKQVAAIPKGETLVLPVSFFKERLYTRPNGKEGITEFAHRPILDAVRLHRAMMLAATRIPEGSEPERFIEAWHEEKADFLDSLPTRNAATPLIVELWSEFTGVWEQEVLKENRAQFRQALLEAPLIVLGLLVEFDEEHIRSAMTAGPPAGTMMTIPSGTSIYGGGFGGYSHAAVHHARAMSRIHYRHHRRMARFRY